MENTTETKKVEFREVKKGYSRDEVDEYIRILSYEYEQVLKELKLSEERYKDLEEENDELREKVRKAGKNTSSAEKEAISSLLIKAELIARDIKANAEKEALEQKTKIQKELQLLDSTKREMVSEMQKFSQAIMRVVEEHGSQR